MQNVTECMTKGIFPKIRKTPQAPDITGDMYPQYWTPSIGGIIMKYSYEYKLMCVDLYRQGKWADTPEGVKEKIFHDP